MGDQAEHTTFAVKDCTLAAIATGRVAFTLRELKNEIENIHPESLYYHFWGGLLRPRFDDPEYHNDFAIWAKYALGDPETAEKLGIIDPCDYRDIEDLRRELVEILEQRLSENEMASWVRPGEHFFYFVRSQIVVFDTRKRFENPEELAEALPGLSVGSIFYHFIDARRRQPMGMDDFRSWLDSSFKGYDDLAAHLAEVDPFFSGLKELRNRLTEVFREHLC